MTPLWRRWYCRASVISASTKSRIRPRPSTSVTLHPSAASIEAYSVPITPPQRALLHGDRRCLSIAAASILAKVFRDEMMKEFDDFYPAYRFRRNKGYPTLEHRRAIGVMGLSPLHRRTFSSQLLLPQQGQ